MFSATHDLFADAHMLSPTHCPPSSETAPFISLHFPSDIPVTWLEKIWKKQHGFAAQFPVLLLRTRQNIGSLHSKRVP